MRDEERPCQCGKSHPWGILRYSRDQTPLYGPRPLPDCDNFRPVVDNVPAGVDARELWQQTGDLDAQATLATRIAVARIRSLGKDKNVYGAMAAQWPDFMGFVISQITDMRGALVRNDSKFAHLAAHTDEIVEAMRGVTQLSERLKMHEEMLGQIYDKVMAMGRDPLAEDEALRHFGLLEPEEDSLFDPRRFTPSSPTEPVVVESEPRHDDDEHQNDDADDDENGNGDEDEE